MIPDDLPRPEEARTTFSPIFSEGLLSIIPSTTRRLFKLVTIHIFFFFVYVTSQHILYYCTYYSVSLTCTVHCVHCTIDIDTLYVLHMFPVSLFPMLGFHLQHLFTHLFTLILVHTLSSIHILVFT